MDNSIESARKQFVTDLEKSLRNLYDPVQLRKSPLTSWLNLVVQDDAAITVRRTIVAAIQSLKPDGRIPAEAQARRIYEVLTYRFVEQTSQKEVANDLSLSIRQLRRLEIQAILTLADQLLTRQPDNRINNMLKNDESVEMFSPPLPEINNSVHTKAHELARLRTSLEKDEIDLLDLINQVMRTSEPLATRWNVEIRVELDAPSTSVSVHTVTMRQALLNIMTVALQFACEGQLTIRYQVRDRMAIIGFLPTCLDAGVIPLSVESLDALHLAGELVELSLGKIQIAPADQPWRVEVLLNRLERIPIFVIDDNTDALRLIERYLEGTPFRCSGVSDPTRAIIAAEEHNAQIILLDVMLPDIDGWELLGRIREHPRLGRVPVIITTILPQETLALTLGAAGFLRKPFTQAALLEVLTQQMDAVEKG